MVLALGVIAAVLVASALIVIARDLSDGDDPGPATTSRPAATPTGVPTPTGPRTDSPPPVNGCGSASETPRGIDGQAAARQLCHRYADRLRRVTDTMFECELGGRIEDCRAEARAAWATLTELMADSSYREAKALLDGAIELAEGSGRSYLSPACQGRNEPMDRTATDCTTDYSSFGVGLSALEYLLRSM